MKPPQLREGDLQNKEWRLKLGKKKKKKVIRPWILAHIELFGSNFFLLLFLILWPRACVLSTPGVPLSRPGWRDPSRQRGLGIIEVVFFLITYKNIDKANHQPYDFAQVTGPLNSLNKARINAFPTVL